MPPTGRAAASARCPAVFERDTNGTEADWLRWLPGACGAHAWSQPAPGRAVVALTPGTLTLDWQPLPPRRIALVSLPRLLVRYRFDDVEAARRDAFMQHFDLHMQRGGG